MPGGPGPRTRHLPIGAAGPTQPRGPRAGGMARPRLLLLLASALMVKLEPQTLSGVAALQVPAAEAGCRWRSPAWYPSLDSAPKVAGRTGLTAPRWR
jgi:hypothetical protein